MFYLGILISQVPCGYVVTKFSSTRYWETMFRMFGSCLFVVCIFVAVTVVVGVVVVVSVFIVVFVIIFVFMIIMGACGVLISFGKLDIF